MLQPLPHSAAGSVPVEFPWITQPIHEQSSPQGQLAVSPAHESPNGYDTKKKSLAESVCSSLPEAASEGVCEAGGDTFPSLLILTPGAIPLIASFIKAISLSPPDDAAGMWPLMASFMRATSLEGPIPA